MKRVWIALAFLSLANSLAAQTVKVPEKVETQVGRLAAITIESDGKETQWVVVPSGEVDAFREYDPDPKIMRVRVISYRNGSYTLVAWTAKGDKPSRPATCVIQVGPAPVPVPPTPPTPPDPPTPPQPDTPLVASLKAALAKESASDKAKVATFGDICDRTANATAGLSLVKDVNDFYVTAMKGEIGSALPNLRDAVNAELNAKLPRTLNAPLDSTVKPIVIQLFKDLATALKGLKP